MKWANGWKRFVPALLVAGGLLAFGGSQAYAQTHNQKQEKRALKDHQRYERDQYGGGAVRDHQRQESGAFKRKEQQERRGAYGVYGPYNQPPYYGGYPNQGGYSYPNIGGYPNQGGYSYPNIGRYPSRPGGYYGGYGWPGQGRGRWHNQGYGNHRGRH